MSSSSTKSLSSETSSFRRSKSDSYIKEEVMSDKSMNVKPPKPPTKKKELEVEKNINSNKEKQNKKIYQDDDHITDTDYTISPVKPKPPPKKSSDNNTTTTTTTIKRHSSSNNVVEDDIKLQQQQLKEVIGDTVKPKAPIPSSSSSTTLKKSQQQSPNSMKHKSPLKKEKKRHDSDDDFTETEGEEEEEVEEVFPKAKPKAPPKKKLSLDSAISQIKKEMEEQTSSSTSMSKNKSKLTRSTSAIGTTMTTKTKKDDVSTLDNVKPKKSAPKRKSKESHLDSDSEDELKLEKEIKKGITALKKSKSNITKQYNGDKETKPTKKKSTTTNNNSKKDVNITTTKDSSKTLLEECNRIIDDLQPNDSTRVMNTLAQLATLLCQDSGQISLILRSHNIMSTLNETLLRLARICSLNSDTPTPSSSASNTPTVALSPANSNNILSLSPSSSLLYYEQSINNGHIIKRSNSSLEGEDLLKQFLSASTSSSNIFADDSILHDLDEPDTQPLDTIYIDDVKSSKKRSISSSGSSSDHPFKKPSTCNVVSEGNECSFTSQEKNGIILSICFIYYLFSNQNSNIDQFSKDVIEFISSQATTIPDNYQLEYFSSPSKLPKSPKSGGNRKPTVLTLSINNLFQQIVPDTGRISATPSSLSLNVLCNLIIQSKQTNNTSIRSKYQEYKVIDQLINLLSKYTLYLSPLIESTTISPKLIGNIEKVTKIIDEFVIQDISNRNILVNTRTLTILITLLSYIQNIIVNNKERLSGIDIKLGGTESILSILSILLNVTHSNKEASSIIGTIQTPYQYKNTNNNVSTQLQKSSSSSSIPSSSSTLSTTNSTTTTTTTTYIDPTDQLEQHLKQTKMTPRKVKYLEGLQKCKQFAIQSLINLLHIEVPEKYDIGQLTVSLLVNLLEGDPENRIRFRSTQGAIDSILKQYLWRTSDRVLTRFTSKTQEKVASSYLVILIGFLIKENPENRQIVVTQLNATPTIFTDMVKLLVDFIGFQGPQHLLSRNIYRICDNLICSVFLLPTFTTSNTNNHTIDDQEYKQIIEKEREEYESFKMEFESKFQYRSGDVKDVDESDQDDD